MMCEYPLTVYNNVIQTVQLLISSHIRAIYNIIFKSGLNRPFWPNIRQKDLGDQSNIYRGW